MKIQENKSFKDLTTFRIGGKIKYFAEPKNKKEVEEAVCFAKSNNLEIFILGGGSDFLAGDKEFRGMVIKYSGKNYSISKNKITAEAGMWWDDLVAVAVENNLQGIECLSGIPGTVGAAPIQNIGAYGQEIKDTFESLVAYDIEKEQFVAFSKSDCKLGYRQSIFKEKSHWQKFIICEVTLGLNTAGPHNEFYESLKGLVNENSSLKEIREAVLKTRRDKLENPHEFGNAGSFFTNPVVTKDTADKLQKAYPDIKIFPFGDKQKISAGWLIENAGLKGYSHKGAAVSSKHALILINKGGAKASDVLELSEKIINEVDKKFGVKLEREVQLINF